MWNKDMTERESHLGGSVCPASQSDGRFRGSRFIIVKLQKAKPSPRHSHPESESSLRASSFAYCNESPLRKTRRVKVTFKTDCGLFG
ncbi:uncharacterized [Tachysurus ichikawai]